LRWGDRLSALLSNPMVTTAALPLLLAIALALLVRFARLGALPSEVFLATVQSLSNLEMLHAKTHSPAGCRAT